MRTTLKHTLAALAALGALMLSGTACTQDDPLGGNPTAGTQLLQLGKVTIAGAETATRSTDATTRADVPGYTGIRKTSFVKTDALVLTLKDDKGATIGSTITATLSEDGTTWTLPKTYFTAGTTVSATHTPTVPTAPTGITTYGDDLVTTQPVELKADGTPLALTLTHANAMVEVTPPTSITGYKNLTVSATPPAPAGGGAANTELLATAQEGTSTDLRHRTIAPAGATLHSISLTVNTVVYTVDLTPEAVVVAANKRYPITLKMSAEEGLTATVAEGTNWEVGGDVNGYPTGYDYYISTPEDLMWFAAKVNNKTATTATAIQTADIDMSGIRNWKQIGLDKDYPFSGSYNGNGYSIKNLKIEGGSMLGGTFHIGLFGFIAGAKITGIHLRNCTVSSNGGNKIYAGALAGYAEDGCIVTLCSAEGSVTVTGAQYAFAGGLVGYIQAATTPNHYTRCTANVAVTTDATTAGYTCGFAGYTHGGHYAGCIASGKVTMQGKGLCSGFSYTPSKDYAYHAIGCIVNSEIVDNNSTSTSAFGLINTLRSCLTTGTYSNLYIEATVKASNAYLNAMGNTAANATNETAYGILVPSNSYMSNQTMMKTLHYSKAKGYTTTVVDIHHWHASGIWKNNGTARPTIDMSYEGNPMSIIGGNKVYRVKDYYVTAPGGEDATYVWNATNASATTMEKDPCKGNANWSMPTMKDFEAMAGWTGTDYEWSQAAGIGNAYLHDVADADAYFAAFPVDGTDGNYWSSTPNTSNTINAWLIGPRNTPPESCYTYALKSREFRVRCVQKQAFPTP